MVKKLTVLLGSEGVINEWYSTLRPVTSGVPWESVLGPVPFNVFINDLEKVVACLLIQLADDTKLGGPLNTPEGRAAIQKDLGRLEKWASRNLTESNRQTQSSEQRKEQHLAMIQVRDCQAGEQL